MLVQILEAPTQEVLQVEVLTLDHQVDQILEHQVLQVEVLTLDHLVEVPQVDLTLEAHLATVVVQALADQATVEVPQADQATAVVQALADQATVEVPQADQATAVVQAQEDPALADQATAVVQALVMVLVLLTYNNYVNFLFLFI